MLSQMIVSRHTLIFPAVIAVVLCAAAAGLFALRRAGSWLAASDPQPPSLDMIFSFGGEVERYTYGKKLARKYPCAFWAISLGYVPVFDTLTLATIVRRNAALEGFDTARILVNDTCTSTGSEIELMSDLIRCALCKNTPILPDSASPWDSLWYAEKQRLFRWFSSRPVDSLDIGLVSHPFHMRRIKMLASLLTRDEPVRIYMLPVPWCGCTAEKSRPIRWWRSEKDASFVISELVKIAYYGSWRRKVNVNGK